MVRQTCCGCILSIEGEVDSRGRHRRLAGAADTRALAAVRDLKSEDDCNEAKLKEKPAWTSGSVP